MQQLEIGEEKTIAREEGSQNEILDLMYKLKRSEYRGEQVTQIHPKPAKQAK